MGLAPEIEDGSGRLVTGTIQTNFADVRHLKLEGLDEPLGVTGSHPLFSEDEQKFVPVSTLDRGDRLRTRSGLPATVKSVSVIGANEVFNLEIEEVHQYYVSQLELLARNSSLLCPMTGGIDSEAAADQIAAVREQFGIKVKQNIAIADINIDGVEERLIADSGATERVGLVRNPQNRVFQPIKASSTGRYVRAFESEIKILEELASRLYGNESGTVVLASEREICGSCLNAIEEFQAMFPRISVIYK